MLIAISGTPGTGKSSVSEILQKKGFKVIDLNLFSIENNFVVGKDEKRDSKIIDIDKINDYFSNFSTDDFVFIEGHLSHLINDLDKLILLRCNPKKLRLNLNKRNWNEAKIRENIEAEMLDIILSEAVEIHDADDIIEIDTSDMAIKEIAEIILDIISKNFKNIKKYKIGKIDWSEEIFGMKNGS